MDRLDFDEEEQKRATNLNQGKKGPHFWEKNLERQTNNEEINGFCILILQKNIQPSILAKILQINSLRCN